MNSTAYAMIYDSHYLHTARRHRQGQWPTMADAAKLGISLANASMIYKDYETPELCHIITLLMLLARPRFIAGNITMAKRVPASRRPSHLYAISSPYLLRDYTGAFMTAVPRLRYSQAEFDTSRHYFNLFLIVRCYADAHAQRWQCWLNI